MKKYRIAIEETLRKVVEIEAETPGLAVCRAEDEYNEEKHVLSADNFAGADIALSTDDATVKEFLCLQYACGDNSKSCSFLISFVLSN